MSYSFEIDRLWCEQYRVIDDRVVDENFSSFILTSFILTTVHLFY